MTCQFVYCANGEASKNKIVVLLPPALVTQTIQIETRVWVTGKIEQSSHGKSFAGRRYGEL